MSDTPKPTHLRYVSGITAVIDPFRVRSRADARRPTLAMDIYIAGQAHKLLVACYRECQKGADEAYKAYSSTARARTKAYAALSMFESELRDLFEKHGMTDFSEFVTLEKDMGEDDSV